MVVPSAHSNGGAVVGVPWEKAYDYVQAVRVNDTIYVSGPLSHTLRGALIVQAALGADGMPADVAALRLTLGTVDEHARAPPACGTEGLTPCIW
ncbi:hypothetical protein KRR26_20795 [Corallococcus sp. M34]|uniref:hypothetical protein n=1 Tax=Citreicoccus inhibens TaxID=2849499 RepID=UPI001C2417C5|nr:hypothetical protein [Citreicoccus inhibens]MBU8898059.1 hypothetical protein [Citreicoccus inhibens]